MKRISILSLMLGFIIVQFFGGVNLYSAEAGARPKIGVVLSGGGAKGFAHIAVLRRLEELNIPVDYIGGTSMGSTVAALYAMGYSVDELEKIARETDWLYYFENKPDRDNMGLINRLYFQEYLFTLDITSGGLSVPRGMVNGQRISLFLSRLTWDYQHIKNFEELPIPFICIATDMEKGEGVVFNKGNLAESLRASMAIPSVFEPVEIDGRVYLDGGVVNNFPVKEVKAMGADIIIGVDVSSRLYRKKELTSFPRIMEQSVSFLGEKKTMEQRKACDILIIPDMSDMTALDFAKTDEIIKRGSTAVDLQMNKLKALSEKLKTYEIEKRKSQSTSTDKAMKISRVYLHNLKNVSKGIVEQYLDIYPGDTVKVDKIEKSVNRIYGMNSFERISYRIERENDENDLHVYFTEKPERCFYFGLSYDTDFKAALLMGLDVNNAGFRNTEAIIKGRFGEYNSLDVSYLVNTPYDPGFWLDLNANIYNMDFYYYHDNKKSAIYDFWQQTTSLSFNTFYSNWLLVTLGVRKEFYSVDAEITESSAENRFKFDVLAYYAMLKVDTLDDYNFPTSGIYFDTGFDYVTTDLAYYSDMLQINKFERNYGNVRIAIPLAGKKLSLQGGLSASSVTDKRTPPSYWFAMGGGCKYQNWIYPLYGYELMEMTGSHGWVYFVNLQYQFIKDFFLTVRWNEGKAVDDSNELFKYKDTEAAFGLTAGFRSPLGPVEASLFRKAYDNDYSAYFSIGFVF